MASKFEVCLELQGALAQLCERSSTTLILDTPQDVLGLRVAAARQLNVTAHLGGLRVWQHSQLLDSDHSQASQSALKMHRGIETTSLREARILPTGFFHDRSCVSQRIFQMRFGDGSLRVGMYS